MVQKRSFVSPFSATKMVTPCHGVSKAWIRGPSCAPDLGFIGILDDVFHHKWGFPKKIGDLENANLKWMTTRGTPILGNHDIYIYICFFFME